jgi:hypothetical protein
MLKERAKN